MRLLKVNAIEVHMKYRIFSPLLLKRIDGKSSEELLAAEEIVLESRNEQTLAEAARSAEKIYFPSRYKVIHQSRLINIYKSLFTDLVKALHSYRVLHNNLIDVKNV